MRNSLRIIFTLATVAALAACTRENGRPAASAAAPTAETTPHSNSEASKPADSAVASSARDSIAESRCQREQRCENVGEGKTFSSLNDCMARIRTEWKDDLNARECPSGVDQNELSECLNEIRTEDCNNPFDKLSRVAACTTGQICKG